MAQKVHPTGFRIGINKKSNSNWFSNYRTFSKVLNEDYLIRQLVRSEFSAFWKKAGITSLGINRTISGCSKGLELLIYSLFPKKIAADSNDKEAVLRLYNKLKKRFSLRNVCIRVMKIPEALTESRLVARFLADQLEKRIPFRKALSQTTNMIKIGSFRGYKIQVSGRLNGNEIARSERVRKGRVPLQTLRAEIGYAEQRAYTKFGVIGIKIWIFYKEIF